MCKGTTDWPCMPLRRMFATPCDRCFWCLRPAGPFCFFTSYLPLSCLFTLAPCVANRCVFGFLGLPLTDSAILFTVSKALTCRVCCWGGTTLTPPRAHCAYYCRSHGQREWLGTATSRSSESASESPFLVCYWMVSSVCNPSVGASAWSNILIISHLVFVIEWNLKRHIWDRLGPDIFLARDRARTGPGPGTGWARNRPGPARARVKTGNLPGSGPFQARQSSMTYLHVCPGVS